MPHLELRKESFKIGDRKYGTLITDAEGRKCLLIKRSRKDVFTDKAGRINDAIEQEVACWSIEVSILTKMRQREIPALAIEVREDKEVFITSLQAFVAHSHMRNRRMKLGSALRSLPFTHFLRKPGKIKI